jgi:hypothetical protein
VLVVGSSANVALLQCGSERGCGSSAGTVRWLGGEWVETIEEGRSECRLYEVAAGRGDLQGKVAQHSSRP